MIRLILSIVTFGMIVVASTQSALAETPAAPGAKQNDASTAERAINLNSSRSNAARTAAPPKGTGAKKAIIKSKSNITNN
jgi:hypothetical protein